MVGVLPSGGGYNAPHCLTSDSVGISLLQKATHSVVHLGGNTVCSVVHVGNNTACGVVHVVENAAPGVVH